MKIKFNQKLLIIFVLVYVLCSLAACGEKSNISSYDYSESNSNNESNVNSSDSSEEAPEKIYYSKGTFDGSVYINEWANIKFELPEGFSDADSATYNSAESLHTECGMYFIADDTTGLIYISFEKLPVFPVYDEEEYLDVAMKSLQNSSGDGVTYKTPDTYTTANIGGYTYAKSECAFNNSNGDFANTFYVRKLDNYMIVISAVGVDFSSNDALVNCITTAK